MTQSPRPCVIVTRPAREAQLWVHELMQAGLPAKALPLIDIRALDDTGPVQRAWQHLGDYAAVMFVSANAVFGFYASKPSSNPLKSTLAQAWTTGPGTVHALQQVGVPLERIEAPALDAVQFDSEALWQRVGAVVRPGQRMLIVRGTDGQADRAEQGLGRDWLASRLKEAGAEVDFVAAYQRGLPRWSPQQGQLATDAARDGSVWLFSSSEAIANLRANLPGQSWARARAVATHARIAAAAKAAGFGVVCESRPTVADIVGSIESIR